MPITVVYPKVSLEVATGRISRWLVAEGEAVRAGQTLFEIETDKSAVEVDAPGAGTIRHLTAPGTEVEVGGPVATIYAEGEAVADPAPAPAGAAPAGTVPAPSSVQAAAGPLAAQAAAPGGARAGRGPNPTPLARRIARENGLSLAGLPGTGPRGRVQRADVLALLERAATVPAAPEGAGLHAQWLRRGAGRPVVAIHGYSADLNNWRGLLAGAPSPWPVLGLDLPCHGRSPRAVPADLDAVAAAVEAALAAHGVEDCVIAGHSFGAAVAARLAARGIADVRALCLFAPAGLSPEVDHGFTEGILRAQGAASLRPWLEWLVHDPAVISETFVQVVAGQRADAGLTAAMRGFAARFFADGTQCFSAREDLARLTQPVRVVFGRQDRVLPFAATRALPPNVALHALDGCGHMPHLEQPGLALRILSELARSA